MSGGALKAFLGGEEGTGQNECRGSHRSGSGGAGACPSLAAEHGSVHHHTQEGFMAAGMKGK